MIQLGLTAKEIKAVEKKINYILKQNKKGKYELFKYPCSRSHFCPSVDLKKIVPEKLHFFQILGCKNNAL